MKFDNVLSTLRTIHPDDADFVRLLKELCEGLNECLPSFVHLQRCSDDPGPEFDDLQTSIGWDWNTFVDLCTYLASQQAHGLFRAQDERNLILGFLQYFAK